MSAKIQAQQPKTPSPLIAYIGGGRGKIATRQESGEWLVEDITVPDVRAKLDLYKQNQKSK